jgi:soluble lytic murein transglycosylase
MKIKSKHIICFVIFCTLVYATLYLHKVTGIFYRIIYREQIAHYSNRFNLDPLLISAVMRKESSIKPNAVSKKGAIGLMQLMPATAKELAADLAINDYDDTKLKRPELNILLGSYYLRRLLNRYDNDLIMTLGAYNAGIGNIDVIRFVKTGEQVRVEDLPFEETRRYVKAILFTYSVYRVIDKVKGFPERVVERITE